MIWSWSRATKLGNGLENKMHPCPNCGKPTWGTACVCGYDGAKPAPAPVRGKLLAGVCLILIVVVMVFLITMAVAANLGWF